MQSDAEGVFAYHGLSLHDAITVFLTHSCKVGGFPFDLRDARWNDSESLAALEECRQLENDPNAKRFSTTAELFANLESDDEE